MNQKELTIVNKLKHSRYYDYSKYKSLIVSISNIDDVNKYKNLINWTQFSESLNHKDLNIMDKFKDNIIWNKVSNSEIRKLPFDFIESHKDYVTMDILIKNRYQFTEEYLEEHFDEIGEFNIVKSQDLTEDFIERNIDKFKFINICKFQEDISKDFILRHVDKLTPQCFDHIVTLLDEEDIIKYSDRIGLYGWKRLSYNIHEFSDEFILKYSNMIDWSNGIFYCNDREFLEKYYDKWKYIGYSILEEKLGYNYDSRYDEDIIDDDSNYLTIRSIIESKEGYIADQLYEDSEVLEVIKNMKGGK